MRYYLHGIFRLCGVSLIDWSIGKADFWDECLGHTRYAVYYINGDVYLSGKMQCVMYDSFLITFSAEPLYHAGWSTVELKLRLSPAFKQSAFTFTPYISACWLLSVRFNFISGGERIKNWKNMLFSPLFMYLLHICCHLILEFNLVQINYSCVLVFISTVVSRDLSLFYPRSSELPHSEDVPLDLKKIIMLWNMHGIGASCERPEEA